MKRKREDKYRFREDGVHCWRWRETANQIALGRGNLLEWEKHRESQNTQLFVSKLPLMGHVWPIVRNK